MESHPGDDFSRLALLIEERELTDDLVDTGLVHADRSSHVVPAQAVAQRPRLHLAVTLDVAVRQYGLTVRPACGVERAGSPTASVG